MVHICAFEFFVLELGLGLGLRFRVYGTYLYIWVFGSERNLTILTILSRIRAEHSQKLVRSAQNTRLTAKTSVFRSSDPTVFHAFGTPIRTFLTDVNHGSDEFNLR